MPTTSGLKEKLKISPCQVDEAGNITVDDTQTAFDCMINPHEYTHDLTISYNTNKTLGQSSNEAKFSAIMPETLILPDLILDGTGVVATDTVLEVQDMIDTMLGVIYAYNGENHEPNHVRLLWGNLIFFGRVKSVKIKYTLFRPDGTPLRAKVTLGLIGYMSREESTLRANRSSPDLSHIVEVKAGDTLPLLCNRIYKNSAYYIEVARINNLTNFRSLAPGMKLRFPPLS
jgi:hypothetical protein